MGKGKAKYYAVRKGRSVGIFNDWASCQEVVNGYPGAEFKSFRTMEEAQAYMSAVSARNQMQNQSTGAGGGTAANLSGSKRSFGAIDQRAAPPAAPAAATHLNSVSNEADANDTDPRIQHEPGQLVTIYFDGGSRGNPGRAGYGYMVLDRFTHQKLRIGCKPLPLGSTNNEAEYSGMIAGLRYAADILGARHVVVRGDSKLAVEQMLGNYRVSSPNLLPLHREAKVLQDRFDSFEIQHVYREDNLTADALSNIAMNSDAAVDKIAAGTAGSTRQQMARALAVACDIGGVPEVIKCLCTAECFMEAAATYLSRIWDDMPVEEVIAELSARGWTEATGGPPVPTSDEADSTAAASGDVEMAGGAGLDHPTSSLPGRGQQTVSVAAVALGGPHAFEDVWRMRDMALQQQQQPPQQQRQRQASAQQNQQQHVGGPSASGRLAASGHASVVGGAAGSSRAGGTDCGLRHARSQGQSMSHCSGSMTSQSCNHAGFDRWQRATVASHGSRGRCGANVNHRGRLVPLPRQIDSPYCSHSHRGTTTLHPQMQRSSRCSNMKSVHVHHVLSTARYGLRCPHMRAASGVLAVVAAAAAAGKWRHRTKVQDASRSRAGRLHR